MRRKRRLGAFIALLPLLSFATDCTIDMKITHDWQGACSEGKANGKGTVTMHRKKYTATCKATINHGKWDSLSVCTYSDGRKYNGHMTAGKFNGKGTYDWKNIHYVGTFKMGKMHGHGVIDYKNGTQYDGGFIDGKMEGEAIFTFVDGSRFKGYWKDGGMKKYDILPATEDTVPINVEAIP